MFSAQVTTVRGDMTVDRSPSAKPRRVRFASATIALTWARPSGVAVFGTAREHDVDLAVVLQVVQRDHDVPAVHLALIERLRAVVQAGRVAEADGVGRGEQPEGRMRLDDAALIEQREPSFDLEHALDDEHHVGASGVVLVEDERARALQRPREHARAETR